MKTFFPLIIIAILFAGCSVKVANPYSISEFITHDTQGILTLRGVSDEFDSNNKDAGKPIALADAHKKAIQHLFYMGFPGTDFKNPLITKGIAVETSNKAFFDQFWKTGYKQYVTNNTAQYYGCEKKKSKCTKAVSTFKLNYNILRRDLERNKIINKIGF